MSKKPTTTDIALVGMMIALVFASNYIRIRMGVSDLHVANAVCLLAGMLFGGIRGAIIAGLGSAIFDLLNGYAPEAWITFINKGAMALVCGIIIHDSRNKINPHAVRLIGAITGASLYLALYLFKSYIMIRWVAPVPEDTIPAQLILKLTLGSLNGLFAIIVAPLLYAYIHPILKKAGLMKV